MGGIIEVHHYFLASPLSTIPHLNSIKRLLKPGVHTFVKGSVATTFKAVKCIGFPQTIRGSQRLQQLCFSCTHVYADTGGCQGNSFKCY